jgi:hypothetical protein
LALFISYQLEDFGEKTVSLASAALVEMNEFGPSSILDLVSGKFLKSAK